MHPATARPTMGNGRLFHTERGLLDFQAEAVTHAYLRTNMIAVMDTGTGKTIVALAAAALLIERGEVDLVLHIARRNKVKISEFPADWAEFTALSTVVYHGPNRAKNLTKAMAAGPVDVVLSTYETASRELMVRHKKNPKARGRGTRTDGPLMDTLGLRGKRVLWLFDEILRLGSRHNEMWQSFDYVLTQLRRGPHAQRVLGFTATPHSVDYEQSYNLALLVAPDLFPPITKFEEDFTRGRDDYQRYIWRPGMRTAFTELFQQIIYRKRATDPDVIAQMPRLVEKLIEVELNPTQRNLYTAVGQLLGDPAELDEEQERQLNLALRLSAGHPASHLHAHNQLSQAIVATLGEDALRMIPSAKSKALIETLEPLLAQGHQVLVFTFYAETVLPELSRDLHEAGIGHVTYTGAGGAGNEAAKAAFRAGTARVLLSSDAGAEGLNLPQATYIIEYESAQTFERRTQRFGRGTRITSDTPIVYGLTLVAERTREENTLNAVLIRDAHLDALLGDTGAAGHLDARDRRRLLGRSRH